MKLSKILIFKEVYSKGNLPKNPSKNHVIDYIGKLFEKNINKKYLPEQGKIAEDLKEREELITTGVGYGVAFPMAKVKGLGKPYIGIYRLPKFNWESMDNKPVDIIISTIAPEDHIGAHLTIVARLSYLLKKESNRKTIRKALNLSTKIINEKTLISVLDSIN